MSSPQSTDPSGRDTLAGAPKPVVTKSASERMQQTGKGIIYSVLATVAVVLMVLALNPFQEHEYDPGIDVAATAAEADEVADFSPVNPEVPEDWTANYARWHGASGSEVAYWEVGYSTPDEEFIGVAQSATDSDLWVNRQVKDGAYEGTVTILDYPFEVYFPEDGHTYLAGQIPDPKTNEPVTLVASGSLPDERISELIATIIEEQVAKAS